MVKKACYQIDRDFIRSNLSEYTRKAFNMLPELDEPCILDIGCGSGVPTIELARLSDGEIIGLDNDQRLLDQLARKLAEEGITDRVKIVKCSMFDMDFADASFDVIWSEGSIWVIGFRRGLKKWRRLLKPNGFLVVHDEIKNINKKLKQVSHCGYNQLAYFTLTRDIWWNKYYAPLEKRIQELRRIHVDDSEILVSLDKDQREIDMFKKKPRMYESAFIIMQKR